jgi:hypothetical protein
MVVSGGCYCGHVRYETMGSPFHETVCHCSICRRMSGAPMVGWFSVSRTQFRFVQGEPTQFRSPKAVRSFCPRCGTQLTFAADDFPDEIDVTIASLDDPNALPPRDHSYVGTKLRWVKLNDGLPEFRESREQG